jgi:hypothetical protein
MLKNGKVEKGLSYQIEMYRHTNFIGSRNALLAKQDQLKRDKKQRE